MDTNISHFLWFDREFGGSIIAGLDTLQNCPSQDVALRHHLCNSALSEIEHETS